jgi:hypothetical protein
MMPARGPAPSLSDGVRPMPDEIANLLVKSGKSTLGPLSAKELRRAIRRGEVLHLASASQDGGKTWMPVGVVLSRFRFSTAPPPENPKPVEVKIPRLGPPPSRMDEATVLIMRKKKAPPVAWIVGGAVVVALVILLVLLR